jgi:hypothetical protein
MKTELDFSKHHLARQWPNVVVEVDAGYGIIYTNTNIPVLMEWFMFQEEANFHCNVLNQQFWQLEQSRCQARLAILQAQQSSDPSYEEPVSWPRRLGRVVSRLLFRK